MSLPSDVHCEKPVTLDNSVRDVEGPDGHYVAGTRIRYTCKDGYAMSPGNFIGEECGDDGNSTILIDTSIMKYEKTRGQCIASENLNKLYFLAFTYKKN